MKPPSIPRRYQTVVISNTEKNGFGSQSKRFTCSVNVNPGPGSYLSHTSVNNFSPSFSKIGTGGLASKTLRISKSHRAKLGPNTYNLQGSPLRQHDFNKGFSRNFSQPIAVQTVSRQTSPAPNHYNVCYDGVEVNSVVSAKSAFQSKTRRITTFADSFGGLSPCCYDVQDTTLQKSPQVPLSCFKSTSSRILPLLTGECPGPGAYSPYAPPEPAKRLILPRGHYLGIAAAPLILPETPPLPGPGHYDIGNYNYDEPPKHLMGSSAFVSGTSRWTHDTRGYDEPGPGFYEPILLTKRSFLHNHSNKWIPA